MLCLSLSFSLLPSFPFTLSEKQWKKYSQVRIHKTMTSEHCPEALSSPQMNLFELNSLAPLSRRFPRCPLPFVPWYAFPSGRVPWTFADCFTESWISAYLRLPLPGRPLPIQILPDLQRSLPIPSPLLPLTIIVCGVSPALFPPEVTARWDVVNITRSSVPPVNQCCPPRSL